MMVIVFVVCFVFCFGLFLEQSPAIPVLAATVGDWDRKSFWYEPWGKSGVHKGIDIFARKGTAVLAATSGLVIYRGESVLGGKVVTILGPKWRLHYYAHLDLISVNFGQLVMIGRPIGKVGDTGNAKGKPPHLHYEIFSLIPSPSGYSSGTQGWKRMFYLNPDEILRVGNEKRR